jgi:hypothetical protein
VPCVLLYAGEYDVLYVVPGGGGGDNGGDEMEAGRISS